MTGRLNETNIMTFIGNFFNPPYWFLQALLVYYILSYHLLKDRMKTQLAILFFLLVGLYFISYFTWVDLTTWSIEKSPFDQIHYFMIFLFGIVVAMRDKDVSYSGLHNYFVLILLIALVYTHKFLMTTNLFNELQFLQQAAMYPILYYLLKVSRSPFVLTNIMQTKKLSSIINYLSNHTLEIYIVQTTLYHPIAGLHMRFPLNMIAIISLTLILSAIVHRLADTMRQTIN